MTPRPILRPQKGFKIHSYRLHKIWSLNVREPLYLHLLYNHFPLPHKSNFIWQSVEKLKNNCISFKMVLCMNWSDELCIFSFSWFDASLFTTRIKEDSHIIMMLKKCNAYVISLCIIPFNIVVWSRCSWEGGLSSNNIASRSCNINLKTYGLEKDLSMGGRCNNMIIEWLS